ncbi:hypothetical protein C5612_01240 [Pseudomonas frederiksbergensis]|uniref:Uncharacterized protein n=1 Tax=Pseudomonas frederiksbergensis TaxID=104087 RepID=A0A2S8HV29_9PSED|nr:hypothetical protein [Pseudomonas frederiksbergensis]PQP06417.1 hypothetical protein C5612_01240 [Pseudomonas frederiksbergensis]
MGFSTTLWEWYGQDEYKRVLAVCEAIPALQFLALTPDLQRRAIPYCPACEAWSEMMLPLNEVLSICGNALPTEIRKRLQGIWELCNSLTEAAFHCDDWFIFDHDEWWPIRTAAVELVGLMELLEINPFLDDLLLDCRNAVRGIKR